MTNFVQNWASFEPPKTIVKRTAHQEHVRVSANNPFTTAKKQFDAQIESFAVIQQKATEKPASLMESLTGKVQPEVYRVSKGKTNFVISRGFYPKTISLFCSCLRCRYPRETLPTDL